MKNTHATIEKLFDASFSMRLVSYERKVGDTFFLELLVKFLRFEVFTAVTMKNAVFWDVAPSRSCVNRRYGGTYCFHLQGGKNRERGTSVNTWLQTADQIS
jgi:hypothetical protein